MVMHRVEEFIQQRLSLKKIVRASEHLCGFLYIWCINKFVAAVDYHLLDAVDGKNQMALQNDDRMPSFLHPNCNISGIFERHVLKIVQTYRGYSQNGCRGSMPRFFIL